MNWQESEPNDLATLKIKVPAAMLLLMRRI